MSDQLKVVSPYDLSPINEFPYNTTSDVEKALTTAAKLEKGRPLAKYKRVEILEKTAKILKSKREELALEAAREGGKPLKDSLVEVDRGIQGVQNAIEELNHMRGEEIPMGVTKSSDSKMAFTIREPIGTCVAVSAFNHPFNLIIHQVIPAVATGCPVIVKPASATPISCFNVVNALYEAGLPKEWCQVLLTSNQDSEKLVTDSRVRFFSFIGSGKVGWYLRSKLAPGARCALEHGGVAPVIFEADADIDAAVPLLAKGGFYHAGQVCVSVQKIFVHEDVLGEFSEKFVNEVQKMNVGDPTSDKTDVGPLILPKENDRVAKWVKEAADGGAKILCGGEKISETCYQPTVLLDPSKDATISKEEVFGPVVNVYAYKKRSDAIEWANALPFSFQASVFTKNVDTAFETMRALDAAAVMLNEHTAFRVDWMPFAGHKVSGYGTGGIPYTMHDMTRAKLLVIRSPAFTQ